MSEANNNLNEENRVWKDSEIPLIRDPKIIPNNGYIPTSPVPKPTEKPVPNDSIPKKD